MSAIVAAYGPFEESIGQRMLDRIAHRGPGGQGIQQTGDETPIWLGSRYVAITDPETGSQPVSGHEPGTWLVGDGKSTMTGTSASSLVKTASALRRI